MDFSGIPRASLLGRALRAPLSLIPKTAIVPIIQGPLAGKRWIVGSATHGAWLGTYEHAKQRLFARSIQAGDTVFDLGANVGFYTMIAAVRTGERGRVFAFEPLPRNLALLRRHLERNRIANVEIIDAAVSDAPGVAAFTAHAGPAVGRIESSGHLQVRVVALDDLAAEARAIPDVIKIDIEGGELRALEGAKRILERRHPLIFLATHGSCVHADCCELLLRLGYDLSGINSELPHDTDELVARFRS